MTEIEQLRDELAAAQAREAKLREALQFYADFSPFMESLAADVLALPYDDTALQERLAQEREKCADICDRFHDRMLVPAKCAAAIRSMK